MRCVALRAKSPFFPPLLSKYPTRKHTPSPPPPSAPPYLQGYITYLLAESLHLSGVVAVLFCGIGLNHFLRPLLAREGKEFSEGLVRVLAVTADTSVFFQVGLDIALTIGTTKGLDTRGEGEMVGWTFLALIVSRTVSVFPIAWVLNYFRGEKRRIPWQYVVVLWFSCMRGASSYAFALVFPSANRGVLVDLTASVVLASVLLYSASLRSLLGCLGLLGKEGAAGQRFHSQALSEEDGQPLLEQHSEQQQQQQQRQPAAFHAVPHGKFLPTEADDSDEEEVGGDAGGAAGGSSGATPSSSLGATSGSTREKAKGERNYDIAIVHGVKVYLPKRPTAVKKVITFFNEVDTQLRWVVSGVVRVR